MLFGLIVCLTVGWGGGNGVSTIKVQLEFEFVGLLLGILLVKKIHEEHLSESFLDDLFPHLCPGQTVANFNDK